MAEPEPEPQTFAQRNPQPPTQGTTLRERLDSVGRLEQFDAQQAQRRRQRDLNPQLLTDDVYRARQRLAAQQVMDKFIGGMNIPRLTGEGHFNPSIEAAGGQIGVMLRRNSGMLPPMARNPATQQLQVVDTNTEVARVTPL